jgi:hypothetical protein
MSVILYYSQFCQHSKELLLKLSRTKQKTKIHFICIDKRERQQNGETHIILENGSHILLPDTVKEVPSILLLNNNNKVLSGLNNILDYLKPQEKEINRVATNNNMEPQAFFSYEMGSSLSDNYSYLDMTPDELSAKGDGGTRMMHSYSSIYENQKIETPEDDYEPDKIGEVDLGKIQSDREREVRME